MSGRVTRSSSANAAAGGNNNPNNSSTPPPPPPPSPPPPPGRPGFPVVALPLEPGPVGPRRVSSHSSAMDVRNDIIDRQKIDELWAWMRVEVLDPLEEALTHFDPQAAAAVREKYIGVYK